MNQTRHEQWAYRGRVPQALIHNQRHTIRTPTWGSSCAVEATACVERFVGREQQAHERDKLVFRKNSTSRTYRIQERQFLLVLTIEQ